MSIHRALSELKLIDAKITKKTEALDPSGAKQKGKLVNSFYKEAEFIRDIKANYKSIKDLIDRKVKIKSLIVASNSETKITVAGKQMSVADAITYKGVIAYNKNLAHQLKNRHLAVKAAIEKQNKLVDDHAISIAENALQRSGVKIGDKDAVNIIGPYVEANKYHLVDPLKCEKEVENLYDEITNFESEIDAVLSESNAVTFIEL